MSKIRYNGAFHFLRYLSKTHHCTKLTIIWTWTVRNSWDTQKCKLFQHNLHDYILSTSSTVTSKKIGTHLTLEFLTKQKVHLTTRTSRESQIPPSMFGECVGLHIVSKTRCARGHFKTLRNDEWPITPSSDQRNTSYPPLAPQGWRLRLREMRLMWGILKQGCYLNF